MHQGSGYSINMGEFQSAPGREAGRCNRSSFICQVLTAFQSAPGREAGRCIYCIAVWLTTGNVSIRARP